MLIERALKNPYVVGQSFFWALKSNLYLRISYERFYLLLESFLMLCGKFRNELLIQIKVNKGLQKVSENIMIDRYGHLEVREHPWQVVLHKENHDNGQQEDDDKKGKKDKKAEQNDMWKNIKTNAKNNLLDQRSHGMPLVFNLACDPKTIIRDFAYEEINVFKSKKVPLMLRMLNAQNGGVKTTVLFKNGDDLRQDILTLQIIAIMDKIWLQNNLDLLMTPYKVTGTDCMQGFLEFIPNSPTLATMQYAGNLFPLFEKDEEQKSNVLNTFNDESIMNFFSTTARKRMKEKMLKEDGYTEKDPTFEQVLNSRTEEELIKLRNVFAKSCAGYCVASYVLGLGDRHSDNIMINELEGHFLHIDFGHFLCNYKKTKLYVRETDPFVFTPEIAYFINGGPFKKPWHKRMFRRNASNNTASSDHSSRQSNGKSSRRIDEERQGLLSTRSSIA